MQLNKIVLKIKAGITTLRRDGLIVFAIKALQSLQAHRPPPRSPIYTRVKTKDALSANLNNRPLKWTGTDATKLRFNWLMPPPGKGSGGHLNIFRFIKFLEEAGHECRVYLYTQDGNFPIANIRAAMDSYPKVDAAMEWLPKNNKMKPADGIFSTSWETAYPAFNSDNKAKRFYFVQDFEPYFYPPGSLYALAENSYKFGFFGITAGNWLATKLRDNYGMDTDYFEFASDKEDYSFINKRPRKEILFYARPFTERRGFELGIMALGLFHQQHPEYKINLVGWDVSNYEIPFPYQNLKTLEISELNGLYNKCAAALVLSFTNMSLLPLELLSSGVIPVVNEGDNNRMVSNNEYIAYTASDPISLANQLAEIVKMKDLPTYAALAAQSVASNDWSESGVRFVSIVERETRKSE